MEINLETVWPRLTERTRLEIALAAKEVEIEDLRTEIDTLKIGMAKMQDALCSGPRQAEA